MGNDALQRVAGGQQLRFGLGGRHGLHHGIYRRVLDAREVARVFDIGRLAAEHVGKLLAWVVGALVGQRRDIEVEFLQPLLVQRKVHRTKPQRDAELFEVAHPGRDGAHAHLAAVHVFQHHGLPLGIAQRAALHLPASIF